MTRVLAQGTFDVLHPGHLHYLEEAAAMGETLHVIVARSDNVTHKPEPVDEARLGHTEDFFVPGARRTSVMTVPSRSSPSVRASSPRSWPMYSLGWESSEARSANARASSAMPTTSPDRNSDGIQDPKSPMAARREPRQLRLPVAAVAPPSRTTTRLNAAGADTT